MIVHCRITEPFPKPGHLTSRLCSQLAALPIPQKTLDRGQSEVARCSNDEFNFTSVPAGCKEPSQTPASMVHISTPHLHPKSALPMQLSVQVWSARASPHLHQQDLIPCSRTRPHLSDTTMMPTDQRTLRQGHHLALFLARSRACSGGGTSSPSPSSTSAAELRRQKSLRDPATSSTWSDLYVPLAVWRVLLVSRPSTPPPLRAD